MTTWTKVKDVKVETWTHPSGYSVYKASYVTDWWFVLPRGWEESEQQFGPYATKKEAIGWAIKIADEAERLKKYFTDSRGNKIKILEVNSDDNK